MIFLLSSGKKHSILLMLTSSLKNQRSFLTPDDFLVAWAKSAESAGNSHAHESAKLARTRDLPGFLNMQTIPSQNTVARKKSGYHHLLLHETPQIMGYLHISTRWMYPDPKVPLWEMPKNKSISRGYFWVISSPRIPSENTS